MGYLIDVVVSLVVGLVGAQMYDGMGPLARKLIHRAVVMLPRAQQERCEEEWLAHLDECEGNLSKIWHAVGCFSIGLSPARRLGHFVGVYWQYVWILFLEKSLGLMVRGMLWLAGDAAKKEPAISQYAEMLASLAIMHGIRKNWFKIKDPRDWTL